MEFQLSNVSLSINFYIICTEEYSFKHAWLEKYMIQMTAIYSVQIVVTKNLQLIRAATISNLHKSALFVSYPRQLFEEMLGLAEVCLTLCLVFHLIYVL